MMKIYIYIYKISAAMLALFNGTSRKLTYCKKKYFFATSWISREYIYISISYLIMYVYINMYIYIYICIPSGPQVSARGGTLICLGWLFARCWACVEGWGPCTAPAAWSAPLWRWASRDRFLRSGGLHGPQWVAARSRLRRECMVVCLLLATLPPPFQSSRLWAWKPRPRWWGRTASWCPRLRRCPCGTRGRHGRCPRQCLDALRACQMLAGRWAARRGRARALFLPMTYLLLYHEGFACARRRASYSSRLPRTAVRQSPRRPLLGLLPWRGPSSVSFRLAISSWEFVNLAAVCFQQCCHLRSPPMFRHRQRAPPTSTCRSAPFAPWLCPRRFQPLPQRQEAKPPGKTSELYIPRQEPKPPGKTSEFQYPEDRRQNHQERHQSYPKAGVKNTRRDIRVTPRQKRPTAKAARRTQASKHQNHHQRSCCRIAAGPTSKEGSGTQTSNHQNRVMLFYAILKKHTCSPRPLNVWQRLTLALAIALLFLPAPWLKLGRPHLFWWPLFFVGSPQTSRASIACRPWWRRTPRCPATGSPGRDVLTCCGLLWSRTVGGPDLGGFWRRSGTDAPRRRRHPAHTQPTVCAVPAVDFTTSRPLIAAKQSPPASSLMGRVGWGMLTSYSWYVDGWGGVGWGMLTSCSWYVETLKKNMLQHVAAGCWRWNNNEQKKRWLSTCPVSC